MLGLADVVHTGGGLGPVPPMLALWSLIALPVAVGVGLVLGAGNATWGEGWVRALLRGFIVDPDRAHQVISSNQNQPFVTIVMKEASCIPSPSH